MKWIENGERVVYGTIRLEDIVGKISVAEAGEADRLLKAMSALQGREEELEFRSKIPLKNPIPEIEVVKNE